MDTLRKKSTFQASKTHYGYGNIKFIVPISQAGRLICFVYVETVFFHLNERTGFLRKIVHNVILKYIKIMSEEQKISQVLYQIFDQH